MTKLMQTMPNRYRIGAVARLTGIPADTLRIWERRYSVVEPERTEKGGRLYSQDDVTRLTMIKSLVDRGHAIGTVARLSGEALRDRLAQTTSKSSQVLGDSHVRLCVVGEALSIRVKHAEQLPSEIELAGVYPSLQQFLEEDCSCDVLVLELPFIDRDVMRTLQDEPLRQRAKRVLVIYAFSPSVLLRQLRRLQIDTLAAPVALDNLWLHVQPAAIPVIDTGASEFQPDVVTGEPAPPRRLSTAQLAALSQISTALKCECPHHMSSMIQMLVAFEEYSTECENQTRSDAALHAYLHVMTAKARWLMEVALEKLVEVEGLDPDKLE